MQPTVAPPASTFNSGGQATALVVGPGDVVAQRILKVDQTVGDTWLVAAFVPDEGAVGAS